MEKKRQSRSSWASARGVAGALLVLLPTALGAQQQLPFKFRTNGSEVVASLEPLRQVLQKSGAVINEDWKRIVYGVVVGADGYILTKASELENCKKLNLRVDGQLYKEVQILVTDAEWDVALLKVDAEGLEPVVWAGDEEILHGTIVATNGAASRTRCRARLGIISANTRAVGGGTPVVLGVRLSADDDKIVIEEITEGTGAESAGLKKGDVILVADGEKLEGREQLLELLKKKEPGDVLTVTVARDEEELELEVELSARHKVFTEPKSRNDAMSGPVSERRTNFARILQHDIGFHDRSVGGPLLDLDGRCIGMNIARASRSETYAIPAREVQELFRSLLEAAR